MSSIGRVAEETHCARGIAEAAIAKAKSIHGEVESRVVLLVVQAEASTALLQMRSPNALVKWGVSLRCKCRTSLGQ